MRAIVVREYGTPEVCRLEEIEPPEPRPDEVLIEGHVAGVNFPDILVIGGKYQILPPPPFSPGKEIAGVVKKVGDGVSMLRPGDRVMAQVEYGAYAEEVIAKAAHCHRLPAGMGYADAAALGLIYQTAYFGLIDHGNVRAGETVLVTGATGGVGMACIQLAKALGATVLAGVASMDKVELVRWAGADHIIDLSGGDLRESLRQQVHAVTNRRGVDLLLDPVGGDFFDAGLRALAWRGRAIILGFAAGRISQIPANYLLVKNISVSGLQWSDYRERMPERVREAQDHMYRLYEAGKLSPRIMLELPLERFQEAFAAIAGRRISGKIVLNIRQ